MTVPALRLVLGDQLLDPAVLDLDASVPVFMAEDRGLCTRVRHHQQKLVLFLAAMRHYADELSALGLDVDYHRLEEDGSQDYEKRLVQALERTGARRLVHLEIEDRFMAERIRRFCRDRGLEQVVESSPAFLADRDDFRDYHRRRPRLFMAHYYKRQRQRLGLLLEMDGSPRGGRWSLDADNRRKLPADLELPDLPETRPDSRTRSVIALVEREFGDHFGAAAAFRWPTTRTEARAWLQDFCDRRLARFGDYQDAITRRHDTLFHSALSPLLNCGLLHPREVIEAVTDHAERNEIPLNSLEGFLRQVIGWREFVRGVDDVRGEEQAAANHWGHHRSITAHWYEGTTGIPPLDDAIGTARDLGWTHHILRLMVIANLMNLCEIEPRQVHDWFMETHVDSADWVMGPNVYGMGLASDGCMMTTKPYICGSNYLLKMSDYRRGDWCDVVDGLYWRFIERHRSFFQGNPRLAMTVRNLDRMDADRSIRIRDAAEAFLADRTA
jgi:deoxyribodipyrimidine photolyase-related protein